MRVLGVNAVFHDPAAALVVDGQIVAAAEEERFSRRKHGKPPVPFSAWELPEQAIALVPGARPGSTPSDLDAVAYSYDPALAPAPGADITADDVGPPAHVYARRAPRFLATALPGLDPDSVRFVAHHVAHAASAHARRRLRRLRRAGARRPRRAAPRTWPGRYRDGELEVLAAQALPHSLGLLYEELTAHLGFLRSSDEYKVMALASYGEPAFLAELRELVRADRRRRLPRPSRSTGRASRRRLAPRRGVDRRARRPRR